MGGGESRSGMKIRCPGRDVPVRIRSPVDFPSWLRSCPAGYSRADITHWPSLVSRSDTWLSKSDTLLSKSLIDSMARRAFASASCILALRCSGEFGLSQLESKATARSARTTKRFIRAPSSSAHHALDKASRYTIALPEILPDSTKHSEFDINHNHLSAFNDVLKIRGQRKIVMGFESLRLVLSHYPMTTRL